MPELGYHARIKGGIIGNPDGSDDPVSRAKLQEAVAAQNRLLAHAPGSIPQSYASPDVGPGYSSTGGPSSLPKIGWTCQNSGGSSPFNPYSADHMGHTPDWGLGGAGGSLAAGAYDQNEVFGSMAPNPLNRAPIGDGVLQYEDRPNPNAPTTDVSGSGDLEY